MCAECGARLGVDAARAPVLPTPPEAVRLTADEYEPRAYPLDPVGNDL